MTIGAVLTAVVRRSMLLWINNALLATVAGFTLKLAVALSGCWSYTTGVATSGSGKLRRRQQTAAGYPLAALVQRDPGVIFLLGGIICLADRQAVLIRRTFFCCATSRSLVEHGAPALAATSAAAAANRPDKGVVRVRAGPRA